MIIVYTTCPTMEVANELSSKLIQSKLCACVNIIPNMSSLYQWEEKVCNENEIVMLIKSTAQLYNEIESFIIKNHPYECPAIFSINASNVFEQYSKWITDNTKRPD